jgi:adenylosuccinate lyase
MRYSNETIEEIWSERRSLSLRARIEHEWLINLHLFSGVSEPPAYNNSDVDSLIAASKEIEKRTNHDVASFIIAFEEMLISKGYKDHRMVHFGLTSSDICDTSLSVLYRCSFQFISFRLDRLISSLFEFDKNIKVAARTHGANTGIEISLGQRFGRMAHELSDIAKWIKKLGYYGKLSGPVGLRDAFKDHKNCESATLSKFGLEIHPGSTQVIPRHIYADYHLKMAMLGKVLSRIANSVRLSVLAGDVQILKVEGEVGSSSMPHKINPWQLERVVGMSRMLDAQAMTALQNIDLWLERDISHSCVERSNPKDGFNYLITMIGDIEGYLPKLSQGPNKTPEFDPYKALNNMVITSDKKRHECHKEVEENSIRYFRA